MSAAPRTRIKVCGVRDAETARAAAAAGADAIGLVFVTGSPREVGVEAARRVVAALPPFVEAVGLFVDARAGTIADTCRETGIRAVQLHGDETAADVRAVAPLRVIKALPFDARAAERLAHWLKVAESLAAILWDAAPTPGTAPGARGGSGATIDWSALGALAAGWGLGPPMILAGGLTPENVGAAVRAVRPYAVDVSSGVESSRGVKDASRIAAFCAAVRGADASGGS